MKKVDYMLGTSYVATSVTEESVALAALDLRQCFEVGDSLKIRQSDICHAGEFTPRVAKVVAVTKYYVTIQYQVLPTLLGHDYRRGVYREAFNRFDVFSHPDLCKYIKHQRAA